VNKAERARREQRILVLAPTSRDAAMAERVLRVAGIEALPCKAVTELCAEIERGAGAILLPEEAVVQDESDTLKRWLGRQPSWSDLPILVMARSGADSASVAQAMDLFGNVTVLERPVRVAALVSSVRSALRARARQYEAREHLQRLERSERELRDFFDNAAVGLRWVGSDGKVIRVNQTELDLLGYQRDEYEGQHVSKFFADQTVVDDILRRLASGETLIDYEARMVCKDRSVRDVVLDSSVLWDEGRFLHTRCFTRDVTDRKRAENALREADRRKDEFLAMLAHELRNPLAPIRNSLHILNLTTRNDPTAVRVGEMMERQVNHMVRLVDDLMEVSRITRGKIELRKETVEVAAVVRSAVETSRPLIEAARHTLEVEIPTEQLTLYGDAVRLTQVIANLLNNAAKYTEEGGRIWLTVKKAEGFVVISVKDSGTGIPADMLPQVFELFTQVDRSSRTQGGLGIGLTLVKSLVEMHDGRVEAKSAGVGCGSEFIVRLPLARNVKSTAGVVNPQALHSPLSPRRILVVDDNHDAADSLAMLLRLLGAEVKIVYSGAEALATLPDYRPSVVLLDIGMPGMDGHEVARRIRKLPDHKHTLLIAMTGWGQEEDRRRSHNAGFDYHLIKPADVGTLESLLLSAEQPHERPRIASRLN
jgi:PAS domain S-box-containing protein